MATIVRSAQLPGKLVIYVKGAPEIVLSLCKDVQSGVSHEEIQRQLTDCQNRAMRTLGFAYQILSEAEAATAITESKVTAQGLHFMGIAAIADPVRQDVPAAVKECLNAGISVKIVTALSLRLFPTRNSRIAYLVSKSLPAPAPWTRSAW